MTAPISEALNKTVHKVAADKCAVLLFPKAKLIPFEVSGLRNLRGSVEKKTRQLSVIFLSIMFYPNSIVFNMISLI